MGKVYFIIFNVFKISAFLKVVLLLIYYLYTYNLIIEMYHNFSLHIFLSKFFEENGAGNLSKLRTHIIIILVTIIKAS